MSRPSVNGEARERMRPQALKELKLNDLIAPDSGASSEEDGSHVQSLPPEDAGSLFGFALGQEQTRLKSPTTPSAEKAAAIAAGGLDLAGLDGALDDLPEAVEDQEDDGSYFPSHKTTAKQELEGEHDDLSATQPEQHRTDPNGSHTEPLPSPWRADPKTLHPPGQHRSILRDGFSAARRRASSASAIGATFESWQKSFFSNISGFPRQFSIAAAPDGANDAKSDTRGRASVSKVQPSSSQPERDHEGSVSPFDHQTKYESTVPSYSTSAASTKASLARDETPKPPPLVTRESQLRQSASDHSLRTQRTLSRVSSLGDDTRFENVQEQVNNRFKAIRDSLQDSNLRMPSLPSISSISLQSFRGDVTQPSRNGAQPRRSIANLSSQYLPSWSNSSRDLPATDLPQNQSLENISGRPRANKSANTHPQFIKACTDLEGDVVVLGGYRGSILRSAKPPHRQLWVPVKVGLNIRKVDLELDFDAGIDDDDESKIIPGGMLAHIGPVDISRRLFKRLRACENAESGKLRVHDYGYDWRLDPNLLSRQLIQFLEKLPCNQPGTPSDKRGATVIAHSLGGLITRHAVNQRPELFAGVVYAGVPHTCVNILGPLRNGDDVLLSSRVLTAQVNFSIRTSFALLPLDGKCFLNRDTKEQYPVDFFDVKTWIDLRLSPCIARPLFPLEPTSSSGSIAGIMSSITSSLPSRHTSLWESAKNLASSSKAATIGGIAKPNAMGSLGAEGAAAVAQNNIDHSDPDPDHNACTARDTTRNGNNEDHDSNGQQHTSIATTVTIPREKAIEYLTRTLASVKRFKQETAHQPSLQSADLYPPAAVIYGKSTPTVYGARVRDREAIRHADAYDELAFASGDGVVLARAAMLPDGYEVAKGGIVSSDRGHISLLGDLEAVGKALNAISRSKRARSKKGVEGMTTEV